MRSSCGPRRWRASNCSRRHGHRRRGRKTLSRTVAREVRAVVVSGILLFIRSEVTKVGLHRGDIRLVLRVRELRNRNRGKNADDDDHDQKLNQGKPLFVAQHVRTPKQLDGANGSATRYQGDSTPTAYATVGTGFRVLRHSGESGKKEGI